MTAEPASCIVLLIHGTWARQARWIEPGSPLDVALRKGLDGGSVVQAFRWSGSNTFAARLDAAQDLVRQLRSFPSGVPVALIAHSHGGSVTAYAQALDAGAFSNVRSIVCMSTPFFGFSVRPGYQSLLQGTLSAIAFVLFQLSLAASMVAAKRMQPNFDDGPWGALIVGGCLLLVWGTILVWLYKRRSAIYGAFSAALSLVQTLDTTRLLGNGAIFIRSMGDEVGLGLGTLQLLASVSNRSLNAVSRFTEALAKLAERCRGRPLAMAVLWVVVGFCVLTSALPSMLAVNFGASPRYWIDVLLPWSSSFNFIDPAFGIGDWVARSAYGALVLAVATLYGACAVFAILALSSLLLSVITLGAFGKVSLSLALAAECAVEPTPEGEQTFFNAGWDRDLRTLTRDREGLRHSEPYSSEAVVSFVVRHIAHRIINNK